MKELNLGLSSDYLPRDGGGKTGDQHREPGTEDTREWQHQGDAEIMAGSSSQGAWLSSLAGGEPRPCWGVGLIQEAEALSGAKMCLLGKRGKELGSTHSLWWTVEGENCLHLFSHPEPTSPTHQPRLPAFCRLSCHWWSGELQTQMTVEQTP